MRICSTRPRTVLRETGHLLAAALGGSCVTLLLVGHGGALLSLGFRGACSLLVSAAVVAASMQYGRHLLV